MNNNHTPELFQRFWAFAGAVSVRVKVLGIVLSVIILLGVIVTVQMRGVLARTLENHLVEQSYALATQFAEHVAPFIESGDFVGAREFLASSKVHYSSDSHNTSIIYISVTGISQPIDIRIDDGSLPLDAGNQVDVEASIGISGAMLHLGVADVANDQTVQDVTFQLLLITLIMIAIGFAAAFFLTWILTRPIYDLVTATQAVAKRDFSQRVTQWANDEIGELAVAFNAMTEALAQAEVERKERDQLRSRYVSNVIAAQEEERKRIARELHDSTGQSLTSLLIGLRNLKDVEDVQVIEERVDALRKIVGETLDEVRQMAWQLRPAALDDLGLVSAIRRYIKDYQQRFDIQVDFVTKDSGERLPVEIETIVYRVIQEGLTNVARHAQAKSVSVIIDHRADAIRVIVEDDGIGFVMPQVEKRESLGLQGIRERAALFNGTLTIETRPGQGTSLFIAIPLGHQQGAENE